MSEDIISEPISLARNGYGEPRSASAYPDSESCPTVNLDCPEVLKFPEEGLVTFRFKRGQIVARSASKSHKASASATLHLTKLCGVEEADPEEDESYKEEEANPIDTLFERAQAEEEKE